MPNRIQLRTEDIKIGGCSATSGGRRVNKSSRASCITSSEWCLEHIPTKIRVSGKVEPGNYSRKEMARLKSELLARLVLELHIAVAKHLRVAGM